MDFWGAVLVVLRRWYVVVPTFLLCIGAAVGMYAAVPVTYTSSAGIVLTIPKTGSSLPVNSKQPDPVTNPLLNFDDGLSMSASILIQALSAPEVGTELGVVPGGKTGFTVSNGATNPEWMMSGPFVFIEAESDTAEGAEGIVTKLVARAKEEMAKRQTAVGAPQQTFLNVTVVVPPTTPIAESGSKSRAAAAAGAAGLILSFFAAFAVESFLDARRARRAKEAAAVADWGAVKPAQDSGRPGVSPVLHG
ncbi:hypothetical protein [Planotetraspora kaengkrachanensis]|nr:hypothetical protein [Planotetraspora kaengkrachanensis]